MVPNDNNSNIMIIIKALKNTATSVYGILDLRRTNDRHFLGDFFSQFVYSTIRLKNRVINHIIILGRYSHDN